MPMYFENEQEQITITATDNETDENVNNVTYLIGIFYKDEMILRNYFFAENGILPITLSNNEIDELFKVSSNQKLEIEVDLPNQHINFLNDKFFEFEIDEFKKNSLINGLDEIGLTLERTQEIKNFEQGYYDIYPWLK